MVDRVFMSSGCGEVRKKEREREKEREWEREREREREKKNPERKKERVDVALVAHMALVQYVILEWSKLLLQFWKGM